MLGPFPKRCGCGRSYLTLSDWNELPFHANQFTEDEAGRYRTEIRHCPCRSTLALGERVGRKFKTPDIGLLVLRLKAGKLIEDWCMQLRIDHGKPFSGAQKVLGEDLWIEYGVVVWGSDLSRHRPGVDIWQWKD